MVETVEDHNESVVDAPCLSESIIDEKVLFYIRFLIKLTGQPAVNWQNLHPFFLCACTQD